MALYKQVEYLTKSEDAAFDAVHKPGQVPPHSGIYRGDVSLDLPIG